MKARVKESVLLIGFVIFFSGCGERYYINTGYWKLYREQPGEAKKDFLHVLSKKPETFSARYNLMSANMQMEQLKDALTELDAMEKMYGQVEAIDNVSKERNEALFQIYFAKAFVLSLIQDIEGALASYQKALKIKPDSEDVKNNIELLTASGKQGSKGKSGDPKKGDKKQGQGQESGDGEQKSQDKSGQGEDKEQPAKGQDEESLKKKNLSKEEIKQILKEIKDQESKVRAKEQKGKAKKGGGNEKSW